ncbi:TrsG protein [Virgibacillus indicus]|uniref:TrsG protein n=1 Tax=Virgibacillus indicus TaxID=2024554 RepID=A0A265N9Z9_9BACI|nr:peptidoglycan DD-metalloendopeptidase family protein [Virgibacillus indicus]OZU88641.1 TrsG protein [Virgibacillus indicus]
MKQLKQLAKHMLRKKLLVGTGSFLVANIIPILIFLILCTLLLAIIGAISGSVDHQNSEQGNDDEIGFICSPSGELDQENWNRYFKHNNRSGALSGYGDDIIELSKEKGIDPILFGAIALHETGYGTSDGVVKKRNPGGLMDPATDWQTLQRFPTLREGLEAMAVTLYNRIIVDGLVTIDQLGEVYAPIGAENDPNNLNKHWIPTMKKLTTNLGGLTMNCEAKGHIDMELIGGKSWISPYTKTITSGFGYRSGCGNCTTFHAGIDIASRGIRNTPIVAFADGKVSLSKSNGTTFESTLENMGRGYGWYVEIDHGNGIKTRYAHMSKKGIPVGTEVKAGDVIGYVGSTGGSTAPHIHLEIIINGEKVDPMPHIKSFLTSDK